MDILLFVVMFGILVFIGYKNFTLIKRYKQNKEYIDCYQDVLHNNENALDRINNFIDNEKSAEFKNKAMLIKFYYGLNNDLSFLETLNNINFKSIFYKKELYDNDLVNLNSDAFVFAMLAIGKAYELGKPEIIENIVSKFKEMIEVHIRLEYQELIAFSNTLLNKEDKGIGLMNSLLDGTYTELAYEKNMIGLYKRIAAMILIFDGVEVEDYFRNDMFEFNKTIIGECFLKNLGMYEEFKTVEEV